MASVWPIRACAYCKRDFRKPPMYATCGHPICIKEHRRASKRERRLARNAPHTTIPSWVPPDPESRDDRVRNAVWALLKDRDVLSFRDVHNASVQVKITPAEVLAIWNDMKKERAHA